MPLIDVAGARLYVKVEGPDDAPAVIFGHALGLDHTTWDAQARTFAERYRVVRYDARGHGRSPATGALGIADLAADAVGLMDALKIERAVFCGLSMGGFVGLQLALDEPERLAGLVLCDTACALGPASMWYERVARIEAGGTAALADDTLKETLGPATRAERPDLARAIKAMVKATDDAGYAACARAIQAWSVCERLGEVRTPTLVVTGGDDPAIPPERSRALANGIEGARLVVLDGARHLSNIERAGDFDKALGGFLVAHAVD